MSESNGNTTALATTAPAGAPVLRTEGFGGSTQMSVAETSALAMGEQAKAEVQARYLMAMRKPRSWDDVRSRLLHECERSSFAATAIYAKPVGEGKVRGFSVRFAEAAMRAMTNLLPQTFVVYDDQEKRILRVMVTDLESNLTWSKDAIIRKEVERKHVKEGQTVLGKRLNSYNQLVYLVPATEDDLLNKANSAESKVLRNHALRLIPGDILDECKAAVEATMAAEGKKDPDAERKKIVDAFRSVGVKATDIVSFIGHDLDRVQPAELAELRTMFQAIRDGEATWEEFLERGEGDEGEAAGKAPQGDGRLEKVKEQVRERATKGKGTKPEAKPETKAPAPPAPQEKPQAKEPAKAAGPAAPPKADNKVDESVSMISQAYHVASKVLTSPQLVSLFKAAQLPTSPYDKWSNDERVYGIYLLNEVVERGGAPAYPDVPFWKNDEEGEAWSRVYRDAIGKAGLMREGEIT